MTEDQLKRLNSKIIAASTDLEHIRRTNYIPPHVKKEILKDKEEDLEFYRR